MPRRTTNANRRTLPVRTALGAVVVVVLGAVVAPAAVAADGGASPVTGSSVASAPVGIVVRGAPVPQVDADGRDGWGRIVRPSPALDVVPVYSVIHEGLARRLAAKLEELGREQSIVTGETDAIRSESRNRTALQGLTERAVVRKRKLDAERERYRRARVDLAVEAYTSDRLGELVSTLGETVDEGLRRSHDRALLLEATRIVNERAAALDERSRSVEADLERWGAQLSKTARSLEAHQRRLDDAMRRVAELNEEVDELRRGMEEERPMTVVDASDLPFAALDAYWRAANALTLMAPACRLPWWVLAGIGRTESNHGRSGGSQMTPDGTLTAPITGIALDGLNNTRVVVDSDGGLLDGDPFFDRAVGPMQFIPGTWRRWGTDGSGDGVADPQNMYDAALSAGRYLCSGGPLTSMGALRGAIRRYNNSETYVNLVLERAFGYSRLPVPAGLVPEPDDPEIVAARGIPVPASEDADADVDGVPPVDNRIAAAQLPD